jgi:hypothetical protein
MSWGDWYKRNVEMGKKDKSLIEFVVNMQSGNTKRQSRAGQVRLSWQGLIRSGRIAVVKSDSGVRSLMQILC